MAGIRESAIHSLMMTEFGIPLFAGLLFDVNPLVLCLTVCSFAIHKAKLFGGVAFMAVSFLFCLHVTLLSV